MQRAEVLSQARLAGQVERYHTWPVHRRQSVAEHTWQVLRIYSTLFGPPRPEVTVYILWHDAGELVTGDPPFPVKANNPELKRVYDDLEAEAVAAMGGPSPMPLLATFERVRVKCCDLLEMHEFGKHELALGNHFAQPIIEDTLVAVRRLACDLPVSDGALIEGYVVLGRKPEDASN